MSQDADVIPSVARDLAASSELAGKIPRYARDDTSTPTRVDDEPARDHPVSADLKRLTREQLPELAQEIRDRLIECCSITGGHIGASLGVVELSIALLYEFDSPADKIVWDVGHQAYAWKLLTGRNDPFPTLRQRNGISGFLKRDESEHDQFGAGHAGTAMSAAFGMATARDLRGEKHKVVAVVGDGALTCGLSYEGHEQRRPLRSRHHPDRERQRDVDLPQRRRDQQDARPRSSPTRAPTVCARRSRG